MIAIGQDYDLGVDLEYFSPRSLLGIAQHCFSEHEIKTLTTVPTTCQMLAFFSIWAQKEAFIKAVGMGLSYPLKEFSVTAFPENDYLITDHLTHTPWRLSAFMPQPACSGALCVSPKIQIYRAIKLDSLDSLEAFL